MSKRLPSPFAELEPWVAEWAIEDGHERYVKRVNSSMTQLRQFYDAVFPHATDAVIYLDQFDHHEPLPDDAAKSRKQLYSLITDSRATELRTQPSVRPTDNSHLTVRSTRK